MTRKLSVLLVLAFFVMSLVSMAFAANAKKAAQNRPFVSEAAAPAIVTFTDNDGSGTEAFGKPATAQPTAMGYYMVNEVQVGNTEFDWQSNDRMQRQVAMGSDNKVHTVWTNRDFGMEPAGPRSVVYSGFTAGSGIAPVSPWSISPLSGSGGTSGGYGSIAVGPGDDRAVATFHYTKGAPPTATYDTRLRAMIGRQAAPLSTSFLMFDYPSSDTIMPKQLNCVPRITGLDTLEGGYIWPSIAADNNGTATIAHVLARESAPSYGTGTSAYTVDTTGKASLVYWKTLPNATFPGVYTCGTLIDSMASSLNYDIAASPASNKVAIVYNYPKTWTGYDLGDNDDVYYRESSDLGDSWSANRIPIRIFTNADSSGTYYERADEVSALYDTDDCLHVLYRSYWAGIQASDGLHYYLVYPARIYHWSACPTPCTVMLIDAFGTWGPAVSAWPPRGQQLVAKINLAQCNIGTDKRLYAVYTMFPDSSGNEGNTYSDRSAKPILNGEVVVQASTDLSGSLWGPVVNISNTRSDGCAANACFSETYTNAAPYTTDSLRIQYLLDKDAGAAIQGTAGSQGILTDNPVIIRSYPCFAPATYANLAVSTSADLTWPGIHVTPNGTTPVSLTLTNTGNTPAVYSRTVDPPGSMLTFANPDNSSVPAGCVATLAEVMTVHGPATEGLYTAEVTWSYTGGKTTKMKVEVWNFTNWFMETNKSIRTAHVAMTTNQSSRVGSQRDGYDGFWYFSDSKTKSYVFDGSLLIATSNMKISTLVHAGTGVIGGTDSVITRLFCLSNMSFDTMPATGKDYGYRRSSGRGCNGDSTIGFDAAFYAPRHVDSAGFMIGMFSLYAGPKDPDATINNVSVCFGADLDIPDDSSWNLGDVDASRQMVYQTGKYGTAPTRHGALAGFFKDESPIAGGMVMDNRHWLYPHNGYENDSIWNRIQATSGFTPYGADPINDTAKDLNSMLVFSKTATITPKTTGLYTIYVIFAGQPLGGTVDGLNGEVAKGIEFIKKYNYFECNNCGDANSDDVFDISDAVFLIGYIFSGGPAPGDCIYPNGKGDANGDGVVDISDAVYLIGYIFSGGNPPHCQ